MTSVLKKSLKAHIEFKNYLKDFDCENKKIKLKIVHTNGVIHCATEIAKRMNLPEEDRQLAELIACLKKCKVLKRSFGKM